MAQPYVTVPHSTGDGREPRVTCSNVNDVKTLMFFFLYAGGPQDRTGILRIALHSYPSTSLERAQHK